MVASRCWSFGTDHVFIRIVNDLFLFSFEFLYDFRLPRLQTRLKKASSGTSICDHWCSNHSGFKWLVHWFTLGLPHGEDVLPLALPETDKLPLKTDGWETILTFLSGLGPYFPRPTVSFGEGIMFPFSNGEHQLLRTCLIGLEFDLLSYH